MPEETKQALHELRVHQVELEMQNEELRRAYAELDAARARYFDLYDLAPVGYCTLSEEGLILEANLTAAGLLGVARGKLVGQPITRFILPEDQDLYYRHRKQVFEPGAPQACELRMLRHDATPFWARLESTRGHDDTSDAPVCRTTMDDITERKQAEVALRVSGERHSTILRTAMDGFWLADQQGRLLEANEAYCRMSGYSMQELLALRISDLEAIETAVDIDARIQKITALGEVRFESRHRRKDGTFFDVEVCVQYRPTEGGPLVTFLRDITERKWAETEREKNLARQEGITLLQRSLLAPHALDDKLKRVTDAVVRLFEADFCRVWLLRPADLCKHGCLHDQAADGPEGCRHGPCLHLVASSGRYTHTDGEEHRRIPLRGYKIGRVASGEEHKLLTNDVGSDPTIHNHEWAQQLGLVSFAAYQLRVPGGDILGVLALFAKHPISPSEDALLDGLSSTVALIIQQAIAQEERTRAEAETRQAQKMEAVGRLAGGVAHDFNNLLTVINGLAEISASDLNPNDPLLSRLEGILDAGNRAAKITRQLLTFARKEVVCPRAVDLNEAVGAMDNMLRRLIGEDIELASKPGANIWPVYLDPSSVDQILVNLVVNARDAIPNAGTVVVETSNEVLDEAYVAIHADSAQGEYAVLSVTDTGVGMDRETLARIFEPFFTTKGMGTGLGLATVYGIVKRAGGSVYAYSEPGQGTTFRVYLPRWKGGATAAVVRDRTPKLVRGAETVLLVEDEAAILDLGRTILERQGYRVLPARTPGEALLLAEKEPGTIHLLATDVVMPGMNGRELRERLEARRPALKCLYLSGYTADVIAQRGVLPEGVNFLQKPYTLKGLAEKVRAVLDVPQAVLSPGTA